MQTNNQLDFLGQFTLWADWHRNGLLNPYSSEDSDSSEQGVIFRGDFKRHIYNFLSHSKFELASLAQAVATVALSPIAIFAEIYSLARGSINASTCLINILTIPKHIILSIFETAFCVAKTVNKVASAVSIEVGYLAWHGGEKLVRVITGTTDSVLSDSSNIRDIVYHAIGMTLLAATLAFIPVPPIQLIALPIILGSIYGTLNNQFTVRECPEYYTMGHYYDGTELRGHAIKSNNLFIKPIVTGTYATTIITKFAGVILSAAGTLPYTSQILSVSLAGALIAGTCVIALLAAHVFSTLKKNAIQKNLDAYATLLKFEWNDENRNKTWWGELSEMRNKQIETIRSELESKPDELEQFNTKLEELTSAIESNILSSDLPVKYIVGWQANNTRNLTGYVFAGGGAVLLSVSAVFIRIFA